MEKGEDTLKIDNPKVQQTQIERRHHPKRPTTITAFIRKVLLRAEEHLDDDDDDDNDPQNRRATKPARKIVGVGVRLARRRLEKRRLCFERTNKEEDEDVGEKNDDGRK